MLSIIVIANFDFCRFYKWLNIQPGRAWYIRSRAALPLIYHLLKAERVLFHFKVGTYVEANWQSINLGDFCKKEYYV